MVRSGRDAVWVCGCEGPRTAVWRKSSRSVPGSQDDFVPALFKTLWGEGEQNAASVGTSELPHGHDCSITKLCPFYFLSIIE